MLRGLESYQGIVEPVGLPVCLGGAPIAFVSGKPEHKLVMAPFLIGLIAVVWRMAVGCRLCARRAHEGKTKGVVGRLVRAVLDIAEDGGAEGSTLVSEIDPPMRGNFELTRRCIGALDGANLPV